MSISAKDVLSSILLTAVQQNLYLKVNQLLSQDTKPDLSNCVQAAIQNHNPQMLILLIRNGAPTTAILHKKELLTVMQYAAALDAWNCVAELAKYQKADSQDSGKYADVLLLAVIKGQEEAIEALLAAGAPMTSTMDAAQAFAIANLPETFRTEIGKKRLNCIELAVHLNFTPIIWILERRKLPDFCVTPLTPIPASPPQRKVQISPVLNSLSLANKVPSRRGSVYTFFVEGDPLEVIPEFELPQWVGASTSNNDNS